MHVNRKGLCEPQRRPSIAISTDHTQEINQMPDSAFSAAPIMAPALPPINTPVYTTVGAFALDPAGVATADLARQQQANKDALAQQQAVATAALNASNAAAAAELADAKAA